MTTAKALERFRNKFGLSKNDAAKIANTTRQAYIYENVDADGRSPLPPTSTLIKWSEKFGVSIDYILGRSDILNPALTTQDAVEAASKQEKPVAENDAAKIRQLQGQIDALQIQIDSLRAALKAQGLKV